VSLQRFQVAVRTARTVRSHEVHGLVKVAASRLGLCRLYLSRLRRIRSRSLNFPAPSSVLPVTWWTLEGFRFLRRCRFDVSIVSSNRPSKLRSSPEHVSCPRSGSSDLLSWASFMPFHRLLSGVHSCVGVSTFTSVPEIPRRTSCSNLVVFHHFAGFLRLSICRFVAPCCRS